MMKNILAAIVLVAILFGCDQTPHNDSTPREKISVGDTVYLNSGVKYLFTEKSEDTVSVAPGKLVTVHINLYVAEGDEWNLVWSTYEPRRVMPFRYKVDRMIDGFDEVVQYLKPKDRITAIIPPELGYGEAGNGPTIPPNSTLQFDISVVDIN